MARRVVSRFSQVGPTMQALSSGGALLASVAPDGRPNAMTIGWATIGLVWARPILCVLVRPSRYTYECIEATGDFTVNVLPPGLRSALELCGSRSGRDLDKILQAGLHTSASQRVQSPVIDEAVITYECQVVHRNDLLPAELEPPIPSEFYGSGDYHRVYYGEILSATAEPNAAEQLKVQE